MPFILSELPYKKNSLEPYLSEETIDFHYEKHHNSYVQNLNKLIKGTGKEKKSLDYLIKNESGKIFNNASQVFNHTFYWQSMSPYGGGNPVGIIKNSLNTFFGSFEKFKDDFTNVAMNHFGSGWIWLIKNMDKSISIKTTSNADSPMIQGKRLILTCDLWEHSYYIDYRNDRLNYIKNWWNIVNWNFANQNLL